MGQPPPPRQQEQQASHQCVHARWCRTPTSSPACLLTLGCSARLPLHLFCSVATQTKSETAHTLLSPAQLKLSHGPSATAPMRTINSMQSVAAPAPLPRRRRRPPAAPRPPAEARAGLPAPAATPPLQHGPQPPALRRRAPGAAGRPAAGSPAGWRRRGLQGQGRGGAGAQGNGGGVRTRQGGPGWGVQGRRCLPSGMAPRRRALVPGPPRAWAHAAVVQVGTAALRHGAACLPRCWVPGRPCQPPLLAHGSEPARLLPRRPPAAHHG